MVFGRVCAVLLALLGDTSFLTAVDVLVVVAGAAAVLVPDEYVARNGCGVATGVASCVPETYRAGVVCCWVTKMKPIAIIATTAIKMCTVRVFMLIHTVAR